MSATSDRYEKSGKDKGRIGMLIVMMACLSAVLIGCSLFSPRGPEPAPEQGEEATPTFTHTPTPTWPPTWTPTPSLTPWQTPTPTATTIFAPAPPGSAPRPRPPRRGTPAPLTIHYQFNRAWCPSGGTYVAEFAIWGQGGDGQYTYYRDIDLIGGPTSEAVIYHVNWARCGGAPGTFYVHSGDGQQVSTKFWVDPPSCCEK